MKRIKLFCDPMLTIMASVWSFVVAPFLTVLTIWLSYFSESSNIVNTSDKILFVIVCLIPISNQIVSLACVPIHFCYVLVNSSGIKWVSPFKKKVDFSYKDFKVVKVAYYQHIYEKRYFLVMSRDFLSMSDLTHINQLRCSDSLVKIRITKKRYKILCEILPEHISNQMKNAMNDNSLGFDIDAEKIKQQRLQKKKKKRKKESKNEEDRGRFSGFG